MHLQVFRLEVGCDASDLSINTVEVPFWRHVSTGFLDPVLGAMARMAGATVEETAFEDVNMWQAPPPSWDVHFPTTWTTIP